MAHDNLFEPVKMGTQTLKNRIIMAPLTRLRAVEPGDVPTALASEYYAQRSGAGLVITEATQVSFQAKGYAGAPGIHTEDQTTAWKTIVDNVHAKGGKIVVQLWHTGLVAHESVQPDGKAPISASDIDVGVRTSLRDSNNQAIRVAATPPRPATLEEVQQVIADFGLATKNAKEAGFDGVEIHGAHGYLLHQFWVEQTNQRDDEYGARIVRVLPLMSSMLASLHGMLTMLVFAYHRLVRLIMSKRATMKTKISGSLSRLISAV